jgi:uncharacterized membrane protein/2-hydroxychromene-2-carboxylate isomerase
MSGAAQRAVRASDPRAAAAPPAPRAAVWAALALGLLGLALAIALARLHVRAHAGESSFCAISETVNCDRVATSPYSVLLGLPVAIWGAIGFGLIAALAASGLSRRRPHPGWPAGLLVLLATASVAASVALALVSEVAIGAWCLLCIGAWVISVALLIAARRACEPQGPPAAVRADLVALRAMPRRSAALAAALLGGIALASLAYPRYWERPPRPRASPGRSPGAARAGAKLIVEYTDYECPYCARAHEEERAILAAQPGLTIVKRHFPLDSSCNPAVKRRIHPTACDLARAAICAEAQGQGARMDDVLYRSQGKGIALPEMARTAGLDLDRFSACLGAPGTSRRLEEDVAAGIRDGIRALPTYFVDGTAHIGTLPAELAGAPEAARDRR